MTNQEAIELLKLNEKSLRIANSGDLDEDIEAVNKGIKALEDITEISNALVSITERESFSYGFADTCDKAEKWVEENNNANSNL